MTADEDTWDFLPGEWPVIESEQEYLAMTMMLAGFNEGIAKCPPGSARRAMIISADGLRLVVRAWELDHGIPPGGV